MQVAVVGGGGFIGSHVVDHLVMAGHQVRVVDPAPRWRNPAARYYELDLFDDSGLAGALSGCAAVFHLAGASDVNDVATDPVAAVRLNVEGTARVLEAARRQQCDRVLFASTVWVYGATVGGGERGEEAPVDMSRAGHVYVATKLAAGLLVSNRRAKEVLDWSPETSFVVGVRRYLDWLNATEGGGVGQGLTQDAAGAPRTSLPKPAKRPRGRQ